MYVSNNHKFTNLRSWADSARTNGVCILPSNTTPPTPVTFNTSAPNTTSRRSAENITAPLSSVIRKPLV